MNRSCCPLGLLEQPQEKTGFCLSENKGTDQLCSNYTADQRPCFRYTDSTIPLYPKSENFKLLAFFLDCTGRFLSNLVRNPEDQFSGVAALYNVLIVFR